MGMRRNLVLGKGVRWRPWGLTLVGPVVREEGRAPKEDPSELGQLLGTKQRSAYNHHERQMDRLDATHLFDDLDDILQRLRFGKSVWQDRVE